LWASDLSLSAQVVEDMKIKSQNDRELLAEAHQTVYKIGFYEGKMLVGPHKGMKVRSSSLFPHPVAVPVFISKTEASSRCRKRSR
jgi:hypothetical protein